MATLRLSKTDAEIIEWQLSGASLGDHAMDEFLPDASDDARAALMGRVDGIAHDVYGRLPAPLRACTIEVTNVIEAWCIAECVEGSTWASAGGGFDDSLVRRLGRKVESLRQSLNSNAAFVGLLGRELWRHDTLTEHDESAAVVAAMSEDEPALA